MHNAQLSSEIKEQFKQAVKAVFIQVVYANHIVF